MAVNKRKHPRVRARGVAANLRAQEVLKTGCVVENISAGGLLVRTDQSLEAGTPVVMDLVRPGMKKLLKLSGRVVGRVERMANSPSTVPGLRVQFDPMPDETVDRLQQLLRDLGLSPEAPAATWELPPSPAAPVKTGTPVSLLETVPEFKLKSSPAPALAPEPTTEQNAPPASATPSSAPFEPPFSMADLQQITWAPPEGLDETRTMSMEAVRSALEAAELTPPGGKIPPQQSETAQAALAPPPIMPVPSATPYPQAPRREGETGGDPRLMVQIRGLLMELGDVQTKLDVRERQSEGLGAEVERLRRENKELREKLARAEEQLRSRSSRDPGERF